MSEYSDPHGGLPPTIPPPEWVDNATCYTPILLENPSALLDDRVGAVDAAKSVLLLCTSAFTLAGNLVFLVVLNSRYYRENGIKSQPRYILTAMALNDFVTGALVTAGGVYPALYECWPFGQIACQVQALLRGALSQHSSLILIVLAVERYIATMHPFSYRRLCNAKVVLCVILLSWLCSFAFYTAIVLHPAGFHFNVNGLMVCEPYYLSNNVLILLSCLFYFPSTMSLMYCFGTIFHSSEAKLMYRKAIFTTLPFLAGQSAAASAEKFLAERRQSDLTSRSSAAIALTYIILVTPWAIQQVITSCTRTKAPAAVDFLVSWLAASHSVWSPILYWLLNEKFQRATLRFFIKTILCRPLPLTWNFADEPDNAYRGKSVLTALGEPSEEQRGEQQREQLWGEILEKSFSTHSLPMAVVRGCREGRPKQAKGIRNVSTMNGICSHIPEDDMSKHSTSIPESEEDVSSL